MHIFNLARKLLKDIYGKRAKRYFGDVWRCVEVCGDAWRCVKMCEDVWGQRSDSSEGAKSGEGSRKLNMVVVGQF